MTYEVILEKKNGDCSTQVITCQKGITVKKNGRHNQFPAREKMDAPKCERFSIDKVGDLYRAEIFNWGATKFAILEKDEVKLIIEKLTELLNEDGKA